MQFASVVPVVVIMDKFVINYMLWRDGIICVEGM